MTFLVLFMLIMFLIICVGFAIINKLMIEYYDRVYHSHYRKNNTKKRKKKGDRSCGK